MGLTRFRKMDPSRIDFFGVAGKDLGQDLRRSMQTFVPSAALRDRVASIDFLDEVSGPARVLPTTGAVLGLQVHGRVRARDRLLSPAGVTGIQTAARRYDYLGPTASLLVRFTPQGAACLGVPASELANQSVALDDLLAPARAREISERFVAAGSVGARVAIVEELLLGLAFVRDPLIDRALALLGEDARVAAVARAVGLSERQLERRFLARVGLTPKRFARLSRFERAVALARAGGSLSAAALAAGYYDQAHFIRECRRFADSTPGQLDVP